MSEFNISVFIKTMQNGLAEDNKQEAAGRLLLDSVAKQNSVLVDVDGKMITNLVKRKTPVHDAIRTAAAKPEVIKEAIEYYKKEVAKKLNPHTFSDACLQILKTLERDTTVPIEKYKELKSLYEKGELAEFLAMCCLYALCRPNKLEETPVDYSDLPLLSEVNNECPLCHSPLVKNIKGKTVRKYRVVRIFPDDLETEKENEFIAAWEPVKRLDSNENKIALCEDCAEAYELDPEVDEYIMLSEMKKLYVKNYAMQQEIAKLDLEDEIREVIEALAGLQSVGSLEKLSIDALEIEEKILPENAILKHSLTEKVLTYYKFVEEIFSQMETEINGEFKLIADQINVTYKKMERNNMTQDEIVNGLADWIHTATHMGTKYLLACHIIVAFFVQNCEVFHAISK